jgi:pimeloyl-ACP methyl ester carboxylesterase
MDISDLASRPWVLLPGTLCTEAVFDGFLDAMQVDPAQRSFVRMDRACVEAYRDTVKNLPREAVVCGFSLGAIVAAHHANHIAAHCLIVFGLNPFADDPAREASRRELAQDVQALGGAAALQARSLAIYGATPNATAEQVIQMADSSGDMIEAQTQLALSRPGALPALANAVAPVLSLTGSLDQSAPPAQGQAAAEAAPDGRFHCLDGLGHFALLEDPNACAAAAIGLTERHNDTC